MEHRGHRGWKKQIFTSYEQLPLGTGTYNNDLWVEKQLVNLRSGNHVAAPDQRNKLLAKWVSKVSTDTVTIVDYGGGLGLSYFPLMSVTNKNIDYHIVEVPKVVEVGRAEIPQITFTPTIPKEMSGLDIFYIGTSMQYARDWKILIEQVVNLKPGRIILTSTCAGDVPTYLAVQVWESYKELPEEYQITHLINYIFERKK